MRANVKPLTHWAIYKHYKMRVTSRNTDQVDGIFTTPSGEMSFEYNPIKMTIHMIGQIVQINEHGWETEKTIL